MNLSGHFQYRYHLAMSVFCVSNKTHCTILLNLNNASIISFFTDCDFLTDSTTSLSSKSQILFKIWLKCYSSKAMSPQLSRCYSHTEIIFYQTFSAFLGIILHPMSSVLQLNCVHRMYKI